MSDPEETRPMYIPQETEEDIADFTKQVQELKTKVQKYKLKKEKQIVDLYSVIKTEHDNLDVWRNKFDCKDKSDEECSREIEKKLRSKKNKQTKKYLSNASFPPTVDAALRSSFYPIPSSKLNF